MSESAPHLETSLLEKVEDCLVEFWKALRVPIQETDFCSFVHSGINNAFFNGVVKSSVNSEHTELAVKHIAEFFLRSDTPFSWWANTANEPPELALALKKYGLNQAAVFSGLVLDLQKIQKPAHLSDKIQLHFIKENSQFIESSLIMAKNFHCSMDAMKAYSNLFFNAGLSHHFHHVIGSVDGVNTSISSLLINQNYAYLYNTATNPEWRHLGFATRITYNLVNKAKELGCSHCFLQSTPGAVGIYKEIGFEEALQFNIYA